MRRQAAADAFGHMASALSRAARRGDLASEVLPLISRLPVDVLYSELALAGEVSQQQVIDIIDHLLLPLIRW